MFKIKKLTLLLSLSIFSFTSCESFLDVKPSDRIVEENVFNNESGYISALTGVYNELLSTDLYGASLGSEFIEILAQQYNIRPANTNYTDVANYRYTTSYTKDRLERIWNASYKTILSCNKIIENVNKNNVQLAPKSKALIKGESLAIRAFLHFDLLRLFGPIYKNSPEAQSIPYVNTISVSASPLAPANDLAQKVLTDLNQAENLLLESDPILELGPQNTVIEAVDNKDRFRTLRFNYYAVLALKARVYLYIGDKTNALKYAKMVIDDVKRETYFPFVKQTDIIGNETNPDRVFSTEVIFGLQHAARNTIYQNYFNPEGTQTANLLIPKPSKISSLFSGEDNDFRNFPIWKSSPIEVNAVYSMKFRAGETSTLYRNIVMPLIRLGELYLIAAEAETNEQEAYAYLNKLRNQRGLANISDNLINRIRNEYIKEFFAEGQLFFYYKRNNITPIQSGINNNNLAMTIARYVPALPDSEIRYRD